MLQPEELHGLKVQAYYNLNRKCWSVMHKNRVVAHMDSLVIRDAKFVVQPAGPKRVRKYRKKFVHAFVRGTLADVDGDTVLSCPLQYHKLVPAMYNPYYNDTFITLGNEPIYEAFTAVLDSSRHVTAEVKVG